MRPKTEFNTFLPSRKAFLLTLFSLSGKAFARTIFDKTPFEKIETA